MKDEIRYQILENITDRTQLGALALAIVSCITNSFGQEMPVDEVDDALRGDLIIIARNSHDEVIGFATLYRELIKNFEYGVLSGYNPEDLRFTLGSGIVDRNYQGLGIYKEMNRQRLSAVIAERVQVITTTTQNPNVEKGIRSVLEEFIQQGKLNSFTIQREKLAGFYERRLTNYSLEVKNTAFSELDLDAGDTFSLVVKLEYPA